MKDNKYDKLDKLKKVELIERVKYLENLLDNRCDICIKRRETKVAIEELAKLQVYIYSTIKCSGDVKKIVDYVECRFTELEKVVNYEECDN